jgi:glucosamine-phosphate N-acetyltransferase
MEQSLFSPELIPQHIASALPRGYTLRPLQSGDYDRGVLHVLEVLTAVGEISKTKFLGTSSHLRANSERFEWLRNRNDSYFTVVIENDTNTIVAVGSLLLEAKLYFLRGLRVMIVFMNVQWRDISRILQ